MNATHPASKLMFLFFLCSLLCVACSSYKPLQNPYKGALKDLLPEKVGNYTNKGKAPGALLGVQRDSELQLVEDAGAYYESPDKKTIRVGEMNFPSAEKAKEALKKLRASVPGSGEKITDFGDKKKGGTTVGERVELDRIKNNGDVQTMVLWSNGSVLFYVSSIPVDQRDRDRGAVGSTKEDALEFEKNFPY